MTMRVRAINHLTFAVRDLERSIAFYTQGLGLPLCGRWQQGAYLGDDDLWICLSLDETACGGNDYTHVAFDAPDEQAFATCVTRLRRRGARTWKQNKSEGSSFYTKGP